MSKRLNKFEMKCFFTWDEQQQKKVLIPFCYGSLYSEDMRDCTCHKNQTFEQFEKLIYKKVIKEKEEELAFMQKENSALIRVIEKLTKIKYGKSNQLFRTNDK